MCQDQDAAKGVASSYPSANSGTELSIVPKASSGQKPGKTCALIENKEASFGRVIDIRNLENNACVNQIAKMAFRVSRSPILLNFCSLKGTLRIGLLRSNGHCSLVVGRWSLVFSPKFKREGRGTNPSMAILAAVRIRHSTQYDLQNGEFSCINLCRISSGRNR